MASRIFYVQKTKRLHSKYNLSGNAVQLLKALDDYHVGSIDHDQLGRIVRMSKNNRKAVTEIITKCAAVMETNPSELKDCIALIQNSAEILNVADEPKQVESLPFLTFPKEIRLQIYRHYLQDSFYAQGPLTPVKKTNHCRCYSKAHYPPSSARLALMRTSKAVMNEFLQYLYEQNSFAFSCTCDMYGILRTNTLLHSLVRSIKVHWCGAEADLAFENLASCPNLRQLHIVISRATTVEVTRRQAEIMHFFRTQRQTRICDALGLDELLKLQGLTNVRVSHICGRQGSRRTEEERAGLQALLRQKLEKPRDAASN